MTANEPAQIAVRQAIEASVYALILEGRRNGLWSFANEARGAQLLAVYEQDVPASPREF